MYKIEWNIFFRFLYSIIMFKIILYYNNKSRVFLNISVILDIGTNTMIDIM